jgi:hypothetical protein
MTRTLLQIETRFGKNGGLYMNTCIEVNRDIIVDIKDVTIDKNLPKNERIAEYVRQIGNPFCFKCGKYTIRARFAENGPSLEDCLQRLVAV